MHSESKEAKDKQKFSPCVKSGEIDCWDWVVYIGENTAEEFRVYLGIVFKFRF